MAESLSHKFGQIIGDLLELAIEPLLLEFAEKQNLYLDKKGYRPARSGKKVTWTDGHGNKHDLDFVLERGGTNEKIGIPVAFIESAWRRYTKHSRNKAQEIQSAILPLAKKYGSSSPFIGVVLAGIFTEGALAQLKSLGFSVLYFHYETVVAAFKKFGVDLAFDENTKEEEFKVKINNWENLPNKKDVAKELLELNKQNVNDFILSLYNSVSRYIEKIYILPLYGKELELYSVTDAINILKEYDESIVNVPLSKYEILIKYNTGDRIEASFKNKKDSIQFLENYIS